MSPDPEHPGRGLLVAIVGPSGAGKDTLIRLAMERLRGEPGFVLARRVVTRPPDESSEDHDSLDEAAFERAEAAGAFCLTWRAHGLAYGLPREVAEAVAGGEVVLANLSRRSLAEAGQRFARLAIVEITAPRAVLVSRIAARGRETPAEIEARLARQVELEMPAGALGLLRIDNRGPPARGADALIRHILTLAGTSRSARVPQGQA